MSNFLPNELVKRLSEDKAFDTEAFIEVHEKSDRITSIRLNSRKKVVASFPRMNDIPWCDKGYYLTDRPIFTLDPLYHGGSYYVQEASSMFIAHILKELGLVNRSVKALDLCAAPGGKSTLINSYLGEDSLVVCNEVIKSRANILMDTMARWGTANVVVTNNDPSAFGRLPGYFDLLVVDAPCSGSGMFRKDSDAIDEWSLANVKLCSDRQKRILAESLSSLVSKGYLIYSTCSYSAEENEELLDWVCSTYDFESVRIDIDPVWGIEETLSAKSNAFGYRFYPHKLGGEGFFVGVLKKRMEQESFTRKKSKPEKSNVPLKEIEKWIDDSSSFSSFIHADNIHIFPKLYEEDLKWLQNVLYIKNAGTSIGKWTGRELIPSHELALSLYIKDTLPFQEVDLETARQFLRKEVLDRESFNEAENGWCLVRYEGINLGWVKLLPNRVNNYYPKEARIVNL
ncbi:methyltransferase RsmF C-terminal domain-like protein [Sphingobacterium sp. LRF_L2]|uniref:methyltransferase RsmF C-terminal domain-like protein n=1 Tax=Sphingobacterium sp. LRF_L2 TaxID=3369421 RepID=UPI003F5DF2CD